MLKLVTSQTALYSGIDVLSIVIIICLSVLFWLYRTSCGKYVRANIRGLVVFYIIYLLADIAWILLDGVDDIPLYVKYFINAVYFSALVLAAFFWFRNVCMELEYVQLSGKKLPLIISAIPAAVVCVLAFSAQYNQLLFIVDPVNSYSQGPWFRVFQVIHYGYIILASLMAFGYIFTKRSSKGSDIWILVIYCLPIIFAGFLQLRFGGNYQAVGFTTSLCILFLYKIIYDSFIMIRVIQSITSEYSCVYLRDSEFDRITPYRVDEGFYGEHGNKTPFARYPARMKYSKFLEIFLENYVSDTSLKEMSKVLQHDYIKNCLAYNENLKKCTQTKEVTIVSCV